MAGVSNSSSSGSSYSNPTLIQSPQSEWGLQLSQLLSALGNNQYNWAMNQFNNGMGITNANIANYMDLAGKGAGLAQNLLSQYEDTFQPLMDQYIQQAGTYNSAARQKFMMGQAESTVGQADQAAQDEAQRQLQSFGVNPNSGRYQDLMLTGRIQDAAARAGAGTQASLNTAAIGRQMTQTAAQMGQNVPGMAVNALQSAYTGVTGAENAILGMLNTGATLTSSAAPFFNAASGAIKMPAQGQQSKSQNAGNSSSFQGNPSGQQQGKQQGGGQQGQGGQGRGSAVNPNSRTPYQTTGGPGEKNMQAPGAKVLNTDGTQDWQVPGEDQMLKDAQDNPDWNGTGDSNNPGLYDPASFASASNSPWWSSTNPDMQGGSLVQDFNGDWNGGTTQTGTTDDNQPAAPQDWGVQTGQTSLQSGQTINMDPANTQPFDWSQVQNPMDQEVPTGGIGGQQDSSAFNPYGQDFSNQQQDFGSFDPQLGSGFDPSQDVGSQQDFSGSQQDFGGDTFDQSQGADNSNWWDQYNQDNGIDQNADDQGGQQDDYSNSYDDSGSNDDSYDGDSSDFGDNGDFGGNDDYGGGDYGYAKGGKVRPRAPMARMGQARMRRGVMPSSGGPVPRGASPSRGRVTDDIPARLNAGEFVMPRDVVAHKGTEFFKKLIEGSRKARTGMAGAPARPKMKPGLRLRPTFVSRGM